MVWGTSEIERHVGRRLSERREAAGFSQEEFASRLGVSVTELRQFETGVKPVPARRLIQAAETLKTSIGSLLEGAPDTCSQGMSRTSRDLIRFLSMPEAYALISAFIAVPNQKQRMSIVEQVRMFSESEAADTSSGDDEKPAHSEE